MKLFSDLNHFNQARKELIEIFNLPSEEANKRFIEMAKKHHFQNKQLIKKYLREDRFTYTQNFKYLMDFLSTFNAGDLIYYKDLLIQIKEYSRIVSEGNNKVVFNLICAKQEPKHFMEDDRKCPTVVFPLVTYDVKRKPLFCGLWIGNEHLKEFRKVPPEELPLYMGYTFKSSLFGTLLESCGQSSKKAI